MKVCLTLFFLLVLNGCTSWTICEQVQIIEGNPDVGGLCKKSIFKK